MINKCYFYPVKSPFPYGVIPKTYITAFEKETELKCSAGLCIKYAGHRAVFVDARYQIAVSNAVFKQNMKNISVHNYNKNEIKKWLDNNVPSETNIYFDSNVYTISEIQKLQNDLQYNFIPEDIPTPPLSSSDIFLIDDISFEDKFKKISYIFEKTGIDYMLISDCLSIAWLTNLRGFDDEFTPIILCRALLRSDGFLTIYYDTKQTDITRSKQISFKKTSELYDDLKELKSILIDPAETAYNLISFADKFYYIKNPCLAAKAVKNDIELSNFRKCHIDDGIAITKLLSQLKNYDSEKSISDLATVCRKQSDDFLCNSFENIVAINENSAEIHHHVEQNDIKHNINIILIDTGGQYKTGTTDITRTVAFAPSNDLKRNYTLVLKGHIDLFLTQFTEETPSNDLDLIARKPLLDNGYNYAHGTGHGVGYISHVHEPLSYISYTAMSIPLQPGMVFSNEPGLYIENKYGIRIENMMYIEQKGEKLVFKPLTLAPYCRCLIDPVFLSESELSWLNSYHELVYKSLKDYLSPNEAKWLEQETSEIRR